MKSIFVLHKETWEAGSPRVAWQQYGIISDPGFSIFALPSLAFIPMVRDGYWGPSPHVLGRKMKRQNRKSGAESYPLNHFPRNTTHHFCLCLIAQNFVTWPHQTAKEAGKYAILVRLAACQVKN